MQDESYFIALANTLGHSVLIETVRSAAYYVANSNCHTSDRMKIARIKEGSSCFIFIQGTGLDNFIQRYCMDYNPDTLREGIQYCLRMNFIPLAA